MRLALFLLALTGALPAAAQTLATSAAPDAVAVTLYRDPDRAEGALNASWPSGYALITETRRITLPAGPYVLRFEGVAEGMLPESAIVTGLPQQVGEKNRDARLLSPSSLVDAYLKRRVTLHRTNRATGKTVMQEAIIQSGPSGGVLLTTAEGVEALGCSGLPEAIRYPGVPEDLSAKPTLTVSGESSAPVSVTLQLSYLSEGFDWATNYVAELSEDGKTMSLFGWMTVVNGGSQGFADAQVQAIAGRPKREKRGRLGQTPQPRLVLRCWPMDITSTHPGLQPPLPPPPAAPSPMTSLGEDIIVTGTRRASNMQESAVPVTVLMAEQENLGDLKLYRVPEPVTVAAMSRKQVAMIDRKDVRVHRVYAGTFRQAAYDPDDRENDERESWPASIRLRAENRQAEGLGLPLPAGRVAIFEPAGDRSLLLGESKLPDRAIGDEIEFEVGASTDMRYRVVPLPGSSSRERYRVEVTNARETAETFEMTIPYQIASSSAKLIERKGQKTWRVAVPANGEAKLEVSLRLK